MCINIFSTVHRQTCLSIKSQPIYLVFIVTIVRAYSPGSFTFTNDHDGLVRIRARRSRNGYAGSRGLFFLNIIILRAGKYISPCCRLALAPVTLGEPRRIVSEVDDGFARVTRLLNGYRAPDQRPACTTVFFSHFM